jgi:hypothetical protein
MLNTKDYSRVAKAKKLWWKTHDTAETRRKIGLSSKGRKGKRGIENHWWKGGKWKSKRDGYVYVRLDPDTIHPYAKKNGKGNSIYILEHRLIMEKFLGRYLLPEENIHHINGIKDDNRLENLKIVSHCTHFEEHGCPKCGFKFFTK